jgi:phosphatidylserine/phosphatidylglycerophosphate/cardiolipin synthase-like enzyme
MRGVLLVALAACGGSPATADGASDAAHDASVMIDAPPPTSQVSIIVEPNGNKASELTSAIDAATQSVYMTMYEIDATPMLSALVARKQAGVDVQVILDGSTMTRSFDMPAYTQLHNAGIPAVWSSSAFTYTHEKTVVIDGAVAWIMTMNLNTSSPSANREYLAVDRDPADVAEATAIFQADHAMQSVTPSGALVVAPVNARPDLVALIASATTTLDVEGEEFSDTTSTGIVNAVASAAARGVAVRVVIANGGIDATSVSRVKAQGAQVVKTGPSSGNGTATNPYIHAKAIVADDARAYVGSENFTAGSLGYNRELGVIFDAPAEVAKVAAAIDTDFENGVTQ